MNRKEYDMKAKKDFQVFVNSLKENKLLQNIEAQDDYSLKLVIHDGFIVTQNGRNTYINGKYYYDIEDQDIKECYCSFVEDSDTIYIQYKKPRFAFLSGQWYFKEVSADKFNLQRYIKEKNIECIFNNKEIIYIRKTIK